MLRDAVNLIPGGSDHRDCFLPGLDAREAGQQQHPAPISDCLAACSFLRSHEGLLVPSLCPFCVGVRRVTSVFNVCNPAERALRGSAGSIPPAGTGARTRGSRCRAATRGRRAPRHGRDGANGPEAA